MMNNNASLERQLKTLRKRSNFTLFLTWLALFFTVIGIAAGYKNFLRVQDKARAAQDTSLSVASLVPTYATKEAVNSWQTEVTQSLNQSNEQSVAAMSELKAVKESNLYITDALNKQVEQLTLQQNTQQMSAEPSQHWKANEARYLLQVASRKLSLDEDVAAAKEALILADQVLSEAALPNLLIVRSQIAKDVVMLENYKPVQLVDIVSEIDQLAVLLKPQMTHSISDHDTQKLLAFDSVDGGNSVLNRVKESINKAVVIRRYDENLAKQLSGDTKVIQYALLQLKLESLKLLALKQRQAAYDAQLSLLVEQLNTPAQSREILRSIDVLRSFKLSDDTPVIASANLLNAVLTNMSGAAP